MAKDVMAERLAKMMEERRALCWILRIMKRAAP